jgi:hypothetical protein
VTRFGDFLPIVQWLTLGIFIARVAHFFPTVNVNVHYVISTQKCVGQHFGPFIANSPGPNPTNHDFPNYTLICEIFLQLCAKFLTNL